MVVGVVLERKGEALQCGWDQGNDLVWEVGLGKNCGVGGYAGNGLL